MMLLLYVRWIGQAMRWTAVLCVVLLVGCTARTYEEEPTQGEPTTGVAPTEESEPEPEPGAEPEPNEEAVELPGDYAEIIAAETDCEQLQAIFDTAEGAADGMRERDNMELAEQFTAVLGRVDERMAEVGCYD